MKFSINKIVMYCLLFSPLGCLTLQGNVTQAPNVEVSDYEKDLYLTPKGLYTENDILANGKMTRSQKFKDFIPVHDVNPNAGDLLCPITLTKANPSCVWIIGGKSYQFCCSSCIDEFLRLAKEHPEKIKDPNEYRKPTEKTV